MNNSESSTKVCTKCNIEKNLSCFTKNKSYKDGLTYWCRECMNKYCLDRKRTFDGFIVCAYLRQKVSSKKRGHNPPNYSRKEFSNWVKSQHNFKELWDNWVGSGYKKGFIPSADRKDNNIGYSLDNLTLTTWFKNKENGHRDRKNGKIKGQSKKVKGVNVSTGQSFIFHSINQAQRELNINQAIISRVARGEKKKDGRGYWYTPKTAGGYTWEYID